MIEATVGEITEGQNVAWDTWRLRTTLVNTAGKEQGVTEKSPKTEGTVTEVLGKLGERTFLDTKGEEKFKREAVAKSVKCYGEFR